jgi:hypothetical protein
LLQQAELEVAATKRQRLQVLQVLQQAELQVAATLHCPYPLLPRISSQGRPLPLQVQHLQHLLHHLQHVQPQPLCLVSLIPPSGQESSRETELLGSRH